MTAAADASANPAPLGLMGFGMTTVLLNLHNAGLFPMDGMILGMGIFYGGVAQVIAGIMEWRKGNTFAATAFTSYGMFWLTLVAILVLPKANLGVAAPDHLTAMPAFLAMWGVFTAVMFVGTLRISVALQVVFGSLTVLFALLALGDALESATITCIAGYEGLFCGFSAIYAGLAQVLNEVYRRPLCPLGAVGGAH